MSQTSPVRSMADANTRSVPSDPMPRGVSGLQQWKDAAHVKKALKLSTQHTRRAVAKQGQMAAGLLLSLPPVEGGPRPPLPLGVDRLSR